MTLYCFFSLPPLEVTFCTSVLVGALTYCTMTSGDAVEATPCRSLDNLDDCANTAWVFTRPAKRRTPLSTVRGKDDTQFRFVSCFVIERKWNIWRLISLPA